MYYLKDIIYNYFVVIISIILTLLILSLNYFNFFKPIDGFFYDYLVKLTLENKKNEIVIIEVPKDNEFKNFDLKILKEIKKNKPKKIIYTFAPKNIKAIDEYEISKFGSDNLIFGVNPNKELLKNIKSGFYQLPDNYHGVYRRQTNFTNENLLENVVVKDIKGYIPNFENDYLINYNGMFKFPKISIDRVLSYGLIPQLIENKIVIIGLKDENYIYSPVSTKKINRLDLFAYSLNTILNENPIKELDFTAKILTLIAVTIFGFLLNKFFPFLVNYFMFFGIISYTLLTYILLSFFNLYLPFAEILFAVIGISYLFIRRDFMEKSKEINLMLNETTRRLKDKVLPESFYHSSKYWDEVISMVNQTLDLNRVIFLEKIENDHRVKEIKALNCSIDSIKEERRDYEREPYLTALEKKHHVKLEKRIYLKKDEKYPKEEQYLAPLLFSGQILGFWAFGIEKEKRKKIDMFDLVISNFTEQISDILYKRIQIFNKKENKLLSLLNYSTKDKTYADLKSSMKLTEKRLLTLDTLINRLNTNVIFYDIFGKVIKVNKKMNKLLKSQDIAPFDLSAFELIVKITKLDEEKVKTIIQNVLLERSSFSLDIEINDKSFYLNISAVNQDEEDSKFDEVYPFEVYGILLEIIDINNIKSLIKQKEEVLDLSTKKLISNINSLATKTDNKNEINNLYLEANKISDFINQDIYSNLNNIFPLNYNDILDLILKKIEEDLEAKELIVDINSNTNSNFIYASSNKLKTVFLSIFYLLIDDSIEDTKITIDIKEKNSFISFSFINNGFGLRDEDYQQYIHSQEEINSSIYKNIIKSIKYIKELDGEFQTKSLLGEGIVFEVKLRTFK